MNKVTFLVSSISGGGAQAVCVNIANGLVERGWLVDLLVLNTKEKDYIDRLNSKVNLVDLNVRRTRYAAFSLLKYIFKKKPQTLVIFKYELIDLMVFLKKIFKFKTRLIGRNITIFSESSKRSTPIYKKLLSFIFRGEPIEHLDCIINQSYEMQKDFLSVFPNLKSKSVVIHNPVSSVIETYSKQNQSVSVEDKNYILCVGSLTSAKAFHHAIDAFYLIANKYPELRLKFVGRGPLELNLRQQVEKLNLIGRVDFEGFQTEVIPYYRNAVLTLLTSNYEGFPNVLIESIVLGTPVVSFDCPSGPREILDYGKYGKLVEPGNVMSLAMAIEDVLAKPERFNLVERAEFFSFEKAIDKYETLLKEV